MSLSKSNGHDGVSARILKSTAHSMGLDENVNSVAVVNGSESSTVPIKSGNPQGSVLPRSIS